MSEKKMNENLKINKERNYYNVNVIIKRIL